MDAPGPLKGGMEPFEITTGSSQLRIAKKCHRSVLPRWVASVRVPTVPSVVLRRQFPRFPTPSLRNEPATRTEGCRRVVVGPAINKRA